MAELVIAAVSAIGAAVGGTIGAGLIMYAGVVATGIMLVGTLALSQYQKRKAERAAQGAKDSAQVDRLANLPATVAPRELVMGQIRKGGNVFFRGSTGSFKERFVFCLTLAAHEIDSVLQIYFNEVPVTLDGAGNVLTPPYAATLTQSASESLTGALTGLAHNPQNVVVTRILQDGTTENVTDFTVGVPTANAIQIGSSWDGALQYTCRYDYTSVQSYASVRSYLGAPGQAADLHLTQLFPGVWTSAHTVTGIAYLVCEFLYSETAFPSGLPNVTALIRGAKMYDPRTGLTAWAENPALMMRHVMTHPQFGKRTSMTAAEDARIIAAANACDAVFNYGEGNTNLFRAATIIPFGSPPRDALDDLSQAMGGQWAYAAGEYFVRAGVYQAPVLALVDADLAVVQRSNDGSVSQNAIKISPHRARNDKFNIVTARIWDQSANYIQTPITPFRADALIADDGAELSIEVTMTAVYYGHQAHHIAGIMLRDSRDPLTVTLAFKMRAYPVELFDTVTLTLARYGWSAKEFQVLGRTFGTDGLVVLTLKETAAAIYAYGAAYIPSGYASNSTLPLPWSVTPPVISGITSSDADLIVQSDGTVINGVRVRWAALLDQSVVTGGSIEVQYLVMPGTTWTSVTVLGSATEVLIPGIPDRAVIAVRARAKSSLATSDWSAQVSHQVTGKSAPPPNITELSIAGSVLSWKLASPPRDLAGYVFRFHYGNNLDWNSATPMHTGVLTQSPYDLVTRPSGVVTVMGKAIDTSGNVSQATANIVMNLGDPNIANVVEQWDFDALGWPYVAAESSGWTLVSGDPTADALDSFYGTGDQSFYGEGADSFYEPSAYGEMVYVTSEISVSSALAGSIMTLEAATQGTDLRIEYRLAGPGTFYGLDGEGFYDADDAAPLYGPPGSWLPWPGQVVAAREVYQFRITIGSGPVRGILSGLVVTIDAPDLEEVIADLAIGSGGTTIPLTKPFTAIKAVTATLQANGSGAVTVETDKTLPLAPKVRAFNSAHTAVAGATADIVVKGY